jgi:hypothetical protein
LATKAHYPSLFEATYTNQQTLAKILIEILNNYALRKKIVVYVKDEGSNMNTMIATLKSVVRSCIF